MRVDLPTAVAFVAFAVGFLAYWSNPGRSINRLFFTLSLHVAAWLVALRAAFTSENGLFWVRMASSIGAFVPLHFWIIQKSIAAGGSRNYTVSRVVIIFIIVSFALGVLPFTDYFIPSHSTDERRLYGIGYYGYISFLVLLYIFLAFDAVRKVKRIAGGRRLELQIWMSSGAVMAAVMLFLMAAGAISRDSRYIRIQPLVILLFYAGTAFAINTHRIFDARQILLLVVEKVLLIALVSALAYALDWILRQIMPEPFGFLATTAIAFWFAITLSTALDRLFQFYPQATEARRAVFSVSQRETRVDDLKDAFCAVLKGWGQTERAMILAGATRLSGSFGVEISSDGLILGEMRELRWATPERLARERVSLGRKEILKFLEKNSLGVLVVTEGPALTALVGVGTGASRRPFTYPQVTQLMELAAIIQAALERAHFSAKVQHTEQLATVGLLGASLAHEIRNPLVSIKTFVQLLPTHYQDAKFREKFFRLISDEVGRIDQLTEQLLDLASPRTYVAKEVELHPVLRASLDLVAAKAADRGIEFRTELTANPDRAFTDASAAKQVMLNLCFNAIQAIDSEPRDERWVKIATRNTSGGLEMIVADSGPGIAPEMQARLFQPFQTTKSTGFGLGLAICSDILANLNASIRVDPAVPGQGATFRVTFPCQPSLS